MTLPFSGGPAVPLQETGGRMEGVMCRGRGTRVGAERRKPGALHAGSWERLVAAASA